MSSEILVAVLRGRLQLRERDGKRKRPAEERERRRPLTRRHRMHRQSDRCDERADRMDGVRPSSLTPDV